MPSDDDDTLPRFARRPADELTPEQRAISTAARTHADELPAAPMQRVRVELDELVDELVDELGDPTPEELAIAAELVELGQAVEEYLEADREEAFERLRRKLGLGGGDGG